MNDKPATASGLVLHVQFNGAGLNSGELGVSLDNNQSYWAFMDMQDQIPDFFATAVTAMWTGKQKVKISYIRKDNGDWGIISIRKI